MCVSAWARPSSRSLRDSRAGPRRASLKVGGAAGGGTGAAHCIKGEARLRAALAQCNASNAGCRPFFSPKSASTHPRDNCRYRRIYPNLPRFPHVFPPITQYPLRRLSPRLPFTNLNSEHLPITPHLILTRQYRHRTNKQLNNGQEAQGGSHVTP